LAEAIEPRFSALVWTAAASGLRFGELTGLDRSRIDLKNRTIRVDRALAPIKGDGPTLGPPKSGAAYRTVALPQQACDILAAHMESFVAPSSDAAIFTSVKGRPLINGYFAPYWRRAKRKAGVDDSIRFHDLRHLAGTTAASAGGSLREIMARMGHASSHAALRYLKAAEDRDRELAVAIGDRIDGSRSSQ
jgi:integrase